MSADTTAKRPARPHNRLITLLYGKGRPRLHLWAAVGTILWSALVWFIYPYALGIASWEGTIRYFGVALLLLAGLFVYFAIRAFSRFIWHMGLIGLMIVVVVLFLTFTLIRGRTTHAATFNDWRHAMTTIGRNTSLVSARAAEQLRLLPGDIYMAVLAQEPPWRSKPVAVLAPAVLSRPAEGEQLALASESDPDGITPGVLARLHGNAGQTVNLRREPQVDAAVTKKVPNGTLVVILNGPRQTSNQIWWYVSTDEVDGWCSADQLTFVSR